MCLARFFMAAIFAALFLHPAAMARADEPDQAAVKAVMHGMFDRPDAELVIDPVAVEGGYAVAGWTQGAMGGRAFLRQQDGTWILVLCAGDAIRSADGLVIAGVPAETAQSLAAGLAALESAVAPARLATFAGFEGVVRMDGQAEH
jgi:hypothetical protein